MMLRQGKENMCGVMLRQDKARQGEHEWDDAGSKSSVMLTNKRV